MTDDSEEVEKTVETKVVIGIPPRLERTVKRVYAKKARFQTPSRAEQIERLLRGKKRKQKRVLKIKVGNKVARLEA